MYFSNLLDLEFSGDTRGTFRNMCKLEITFYILVNLRAWLKKNKNKK